MITPPANVKISYTALLENEGARLIMKLIAPNSSGNIQRVLISSSEFDYDIEAINELTESSKLIAKIFSNQADIKYNPLYLPLPAELFEQSVEKNDDGDITSIPGFESAYTTCAITVHGDRPLLKGLVTYQEFVLEDSSDIYAGALLS